MPIVLKKRTTKKTENAKNLNEKNLLIIFIAIQIFVFLLVDLILSMSGKEIAGNDIEIYFNSATKVLNGKIPYKDFSLEYPPFALIFFIIPKLFAQNYSAYLVAFKIEMIFFNVIGTIIIFKIYELLQLDKKYLFSFLSFQTLILGLIGPIILYRYDIVPAILTIISIFYFVKYIKEKKEKFAIISWIFLGFSTITKLYPIFIAPLYIIAHFRNEGSIKKIFKSIIYSSITVLIFLSPFLIYAHNEFFSFLTYHFDRGIQIESIYSSFLLPTKFFGNEMTIEVRYGAYEVISSQTQFLSQLSLILMIVFSIFIYFLYFILTKKNLNIEYFILFCFLSVSSFIIFNKVFSPQYLVWIYFLIPLVAFSLKDRKNKIIFILVICVISLFTQLLYPYFYHSLIEISVEGVILLLFRNLLFLFMIFYVIYIVHTISHPKIN